MNQIPTMNKIDTSRQWILGIIFLSVLIQTAVLIVMPISLSNDSFGYLFLARDLFDANSVWSRTAGYPFLISVSGVHLFDSLIGLIFIQCLLAISIPVLAYFTLRPLGLFYGILGSMLGLVCLYPYVMALQVLTEIPFMFSLSLFAFFSSRYFVTGRSIYLIAAILATFAVTLIRVSGTTQFGSLFVGMIVFALYNRWSEGKFDQRYILHLGVAIALFLGINFSYGLISNRTAQVILPHFVFNWVYRTGTPQHYGIVRLENGTKTRELFKTLEEVLDQDVHGFRWLASVGRPRVQSLAKSKENYDAADVKLLIDDLLTNNTHSLRSWWMESILQRNIGHIATSKLFGGAVVEAFLSHPQVVWKRFRMATGNFQASLEFSDIPPATYTTAFWIQVPKPGTDDWLQGLDGPNVFAEWVHGIETLTGTDDGARKKFGLFPHSWDEARRAFVEHRNYIALGNYLTLVTVQMARPVWLLMAFGVIFAFWSRQPALAVTCVLAGIVPPAISILVSEVDSRHALMSYPIQVLAAVLALEGMMNLITQLRGKDSGSRKEA